MGRYGKDFYKISKSSWTSIFIMKHEHTIKISTLHQFFYPFFRLVSSTCLCNNEPDILQYYGACIGNGFFAKWRKNYFNLSSFRMRRSWIEQQRKMTSMENWIFFFLLKNHWHCTIVSPFFSLTKGVGTYDRLKPLGRKPASIQKSFITRKRSLLHKRWNLGIEPCAFRWEIRGLAN